MASRLMKNRRFSMNFGGTVADLRKCAVHGVCVGRPPTSSVVWGHRGGRVGGLPAETFASCLITMEGSAEAMNIGDLLGLDNNSELLELAQQRWAIWAVDHPTLRVVDDFADLRGWLKSVDRQDADAVLLTLAMLASPDGCDDVAAAGALAKCLLPGVCTEAGRLTEMLARRQIAVSTPGSVTQQVNELVASQLWIEVRTFPWRRLRKVAANILVNTRMGVLRELGDNAQVWRRDRIWANTLLTNELGSGDLDGRRATGSATQHLSELLGDPAASIDQETPLDELLDVLTWACDHEVITTEDRALLLCLIEEADHMETGRTSRGLGGLIGTELSIRVAPKVGVAQATVRRRASKSIRALAAAVPSRSVDHG